MSDIANELMREAAKATRPPKPTLYYTLRHIFITSAVTCGVDIHAAAKIADTRMRKIERHYGKLLQDDARERLNRIACA